MGGCVTMKSEKEVLEGIRQLDLESVKARLMDDEVGKGWTREYAESVEIAYKNYLSMLVKYQEHAQDILLSKDVDEFWHTHILQTIKYVEDCERLFGAYLHHTPHVGERTEKLQARRIELANKTRRLYEKEFGDANAASAWYGPGKADGTPVEKSRAALSNYAVRERNAALSNYAVRKSDAALSNFAIRSSQSALSNCAINAQDAALSNHAIREFGAALSNYAIRESEAALSNHEIQASESALSNHGIKVQDAALSNHAARANHPEMASSRSLAS